MSDTKIRYVPMPETRRLDAKEMERAFAEATPENPLWLAVMQVLLDNYNNARNQVSSPDLAERPGMLTHTAGGMEWLDFAIGDLQHRVNQATAPKEKPVTKARRRQLGQTAD